MGDVGERGPLLLGVAAAVAACEGRGVPLGLDALEVTWGLREVAPAAQERAVRGRIGSGGLIASDLKTTVPEHWRSV